MSSSVVLVMGLDYAGKTSLINLNVHNLEFSPTPTEMVEETEYRRFTFREIGGRFRHRDDWNLHYDGAKALIWVVDAIDRGRIGESMDCLKEVLKNEKIEGLPLVIYLNKSDSRYVMSSEELISRLEPVVPQKNRVIIATSLKTPENFEAGIQWLESVIFPGSSD